MVRVGLTMRSLDRHGERHEAISRGWIELLANRGDVPVLLPSAVSDPVKKAEDADLDVLILTGGNDLAAASPPGEASVDPMRDAAERALLAWALEQGVPLLGVCRGFQLLNTHLGGVVGIGRAGEAHVANPHRLILDEEWRSGDHTGPTTNSFHRHGIGRDGVAPSLRVIATSADGFVEAARHVSRPAIGVMWHPERPGSCTELDERLWATLF